MNKRITDNEFHTLTRPLIGLPISETWRSIGTAILFEFGELTGEKRQRKDGSSRIIYKGEASVRLEWSWRIERPKSVFFGSFSTKRKITNSLRKLQGLTVVDVMVEGRLPELIIQLSGGHWIRSFTTIEGQQQWWLFLDREQNICIESKMGRLHLETNEAEA